jgi:catechol 2,3-dioxygenase-like lactoylglutathione lyase family enzyme
MTGPRLLSVLHPVIITRDMPNALAFYGDLLGFRVKQETTHDPGVLSRLGGPADAEATAVILDAPDGTEIEIACFRRPAGLRRSEAGWADAGIRSITFVVEGLGEMVGRLGQAGYRCTGEVLSLTVEGEPVRVAYVGGPDGVVLTLLERETGE